MLPSTAATKPNRMETLRIRDAPAPVQAAQPAPQRILVVDDLPEICTIFKDLSRRMRTTKVELVTETNSQRALDLLQHQAFDLVVSDFRMREVDGIEVLRSAYAENPAGYRVLMTGYNDIPTSVQRIRDAHVDAYLQKPLHTQELLLMLLGFLRHDEALLLECRQHARDIEAQADATKVTLE